MTNSIMQKLFSALLAIALVFTFTVPVSAIGAPTVGYTHTKTVEEQAPEHKPTDVPEAPTGPPAKPTELTEASSAESVTEEPTVVEPVDTLPVDETEITDNEVSEPLKSPEVTSEEPITEEPIDETTSEEPIIEEITLVDTETEIIPTEGTAVVEPTETLPADETEITDNEVSEPVESPESPSEEPITEKSIEETTSEEPIIEETTLADTETEIIPTGEPTVVEPTEPLPVDEAEIVDNEVSVPVESPEAPLEEPITEETITEETVAEEPEEVPVETVLEQEEIVYNTSSLTLDNLPEYIVNNTLEKDVTAVGLAEEDMTELSSFTTINEDETRTLYLFGDPIKYIDKTDNSIKFIDNSIVPVTSENNGLLVPTVTGYKNGGNSYDLLMPNRINMGVRFTSDDISVLMTPAVASTAQGNLKSHSFLGITEQVVEYQNVFGSGIHLQYTPVNSGVKENIILDSYTGVNTFSFSLSTGDYYPLYTEGEAIPFIDPATDDTAFILGQVDARDSYTGEESDGHFTLYNSLSLTEIRPGLYTLTVTVDEDFLSDPDTVYPVVIDPTITIQYGYIYDTTVYSAMPNTQTFYSSAYNIVGYHGSSYGEGIALTRISKHMFDYYFIPANNVTSATYKVYEGSGKTNSMTVQLRGTTASWNQASVKYSNLSDLQSPTHSITISKSGWYNFTVTNLVKNWINDIRGIGGFTFYRGFALKASTTGVSSKHFCSANYSGTLTPSLSITFNTPQVYNVNATYNSYPLKAWGKLYANEIPPLIKFTVNTAGTYVFETMNSSYLTSFNLTASDTKLVLYNSSFTRLAQNEDISSTNKFSRIEKSLQTGTYYLTIINQDPSTTRVNCYLILEKNGELCATGSIYANKTASFYKIGPSGYHMNCFGHVMGTNTYDATYEKNINNLDSYMSGKGYKKVSNAQNGCIVAYYNANDTYVTHFAKIDSNGTVTSKMDFMELVIHDSYTTYAYMSGGFGNQYRFYIKK